MKEPQHLYWACVPKKEPFEVLGFDDRPKNERVIFTSRQRARDCKLPNEKVVRVSVFSSKMKWR
jgi:hypothetical protein